MCDRDVEAAGGEQWFSFTDHDANRYRQPFTREELREICQLLSDEALDLVQKVYPDSRTTSIIEHEQAQLRRLFKVGLREG